MASSEIGFLMSSQSDETSASLSLMPRPPLSIKASASAVAELTRQGDFFSSSSSSYLSHDASLSISVSFLSRSKPAK